MDIPKSVLESANRFISSLSAFSTLFVFDICFCWFHSCFLLYQLFFRFCFFFGQKASIYILCDFWPYIVSFHEQKKFVIFFSRWWNEFFLIYKKVSKTGSTCICSRNAAVFEPLARFCFDAI